MACLRAVDPVAFGVTPSLIAHDLHRQPLFGDESLAELIDRHPREHLYVNAMSDDLRDLRWVTVDHGGLSGQEILTAVQRGRLWVNITRIHACEARVKDLVHELYEDLEARVPGFEPSDLKATLLVSSPTAQVFYHADAPCNVLWHIRGSKRVFVYPALDERFATQEQLERIFTREAHESLDYHPELDRHARVFDLRPGQAASWPHNAPHRVVNLGTLNVSLSTEHYTPVARRREHVYQANRFLRQRLGVTAPSKAEQGATATAKVTAYRVLRRLGLHRYPFKSHVYAGRVDPAAPLGWR
jgi:hypothetical protein